MFSFSIIAALPNRQDAEKIEKEWIERESPQLNVAHRQDFIVPEDPELFDHRRNQQQHFASRQPSFKINNETLKDNEHFKVIDQ